MTNGVPMLHVYLREAEPCDVFDAGGMHCETPLKMKRCVAHALARSLRPSALAETSTSNQAVGPTASAPLLGPHPKWRRAVA